MFKFLNNLKINTRINLILSFIFILLFTGLSVYIYQVQKEKKLSDVDQQMMNQVNDLIHMIDIEIMKNQEAVELSTQYAHDLVFSDQKLVETNRDIEMTAVDQRSKQTNQVMVNEWRLGGEILNENTHWVDLIKEKTGAENSFFQKIDGGYVRIATSVTDESGNRVIGTYIDESSPVIQTIKNGSTYKGRAWVVDEYYLTVHKPFKINGEIKGLLSLGVREKDLSDLKDNFASKSYFGTGYPFIVDNEGTFVIHPDLEGENIAGNQVFEAIQSFEEKEGKYQYTWSENGTNEAKIMYFKYYEPIESYIAANIYEKDVLAMLNELRNSILIGALVTLVVFIVVITFVNRSITSGIKRSVNFAQKIAKGDLSVNLDIHQKDEVGILADSLNNMVKNLRSSAELAKTVSDGKLSKAAEMIKEHGDGDLDKALKEMVNNLFESAQLAQKVAAGDLITTIDKKEIGELDDALNKMILNLRQVIDEIRSGSINIANASNELSATSEEISSGASEQSSNMEEISSSMEEMSANIRQNTDNAQETNKIALQSAKDVEESYQAVLKTVESMKTIADKINVISEIADKIDLLAINAAIEAARAGEHGKGFAVVAGEVRKLAENSYKAANEIESLSGNSVAIAEKSGELLADVVPHIKKTSSLVEEISAASVEQSSGAEQINNGLQQLNTVTQQNAASSEEMASSSVELSSQAEQLKKIVSFFKTPNKEALDSSDLSINADRIKIEDGEDTGKDGQEDKKKEKVQQDPSSNGNGIHYRMDDNDDDYESY